MRPLVIAHRGARPAPENSLASVVLAADLALDGIELDVRRSANGQLVLHHDALVGWRRVRRRTTGQIESRVPTLTTLEEAARTLATTPGQRLSLHAKTRDVVADALAVVADAGLVGRVVLVSYDLAALRIGRDYLPDVERGLILPPRGPSPPWSGLAAAGASFVVSDHPRPLRTTERAAIDAHGLALEVGRVETAELAVIYAALGARALISDHPAIVREALRPDEG